MQVVAWDVAPTVLLVLLATTPLASADDEYKGGYPKYDDQGEFTLPCGKKHTGHDTSEVGDWFRVTPDPSTVSGFMKDYTWADWQKPCAKDSSKKDGCQHFSLADEEVMEKIGANDFAFDEKHPANYLLGVLMYLPWNLFQAVIGLIMAVFALCCICGLKKPKVVSTKKLAKMKDKARAKLEARNSKEVNKMVEHGADAVLGGFLALTIFMAWSMEIMGNRSLNTSVHHAIHAVEGLTGYMEDFLDVGDDSLKVADNVVKQIAAVDAIIFGSADPVEIAASSKCLMELKNTCNGSSISSPTENNPNVDPFFKPVSGRTFANGKIDPRRACPVGSYTKGTDYVTVASPIIGQCLIHCLLIDKGCTGAQWQPASGGSCVLWRKSKCGGSDTPKLQNDDKFLLYERITPYPSLPTAETQCVARAKAVIDKIDANVLDLDSNPMMQYNGTSIRTLLSNMHENKVSMCLLANGSMASGLAGGFDGMGKALEPARAALSGFSETITNASDNGKRQLADMRAQVAALTKGDKKLTNTKSMYLDADGKPYPLVVTKGVGGNPDTKTKQLCTSLRCIDNTFDLIDWGDVYDVDEEGGEISTGWSRTLIFTNLSLLASLGSALGIAAVWLDKTKFWKLTAIIFILWGPLSLIVCGVITPIFILLSDLCNGVEDVAAQIGGTFPLNGLPPGAGSNMMLLNGTQITEMFQNLPNMNYTGKVENIEITSVEVAMTYYLKGCKNGGGGIDTALDSLKTAVNKAVEGMGSTATKLVDDMGNKMPAGMKLHQSLLEEVKKVVTTGTNSKTGLPPVVSSGISLVQCPRISAAYFELKAPICCDIMVAFYWIIWPLSMMGLCTCMPLTLGCCLGRKAFHQNPDGDVTSTSNPVSKSSKKEKEMVDEDLG